MRIIQPAGGLVFIIMMMFGAAGCLETGKGTLPDGFVYLDEKLAGYEYISDVRYAGTENFTGRPVDGYVSGKIILTEEAAEALEKVAKEADSLGYGLIFFDGYRPQKAVDHFVRWAKEENDTLMKRQYYPGIEKSRLFELGYIAARSGHSRGSTIDLTLVGKGSGKEIDMGTDYDFFGPESHHGAGSITEQQASYRALLRKLMESNGFLAYEEEWWHYTLREEPFKDTYFDFDVE